MCGFAAILRPGDAPPEDAHTMLPMLAAMHHRGPDGNGIATLDGATLGHTRLSIVDPVGGTQPMTEESGRYVIVFNGEIYNFVELRGQLEAAQVTFSTRSDTEVLLKSYQTWGESMLDRLNGQFAFLIWDKVQRQAFGARDRFGEKPFYYAELPGQGLLAASEIRALLASNLLRPTLCPSALTLYLALLYVPSDRSIYREIHSLPPAHAIHWSAAGLRIWRYWRPRYSHATLRDPREIAEGVRHLFREAVRRQMRSDVPVGAFLSGGLDSSSVVAVMHEFHPDPIETFSAYFINDTDERPYAAEVSQLYGTNHHEVAISLPDEDDLARLVEIYDEPFADSSSLATLCVARSARERVTVALSGDGADELFGGYGSHRMALLAHRVQQGGGALDAVLYPMFRVLRKLHAPGREWLSEQIQAMAARRQVKAQGSPWKGHIAAQLGYSQGRGALGFVDAVDPLAAVKEAFPAMADASDMDQVFDFDIAAYLPGDILTKVDRATMAVSLESRAPFLDVDLVEYVLSIPWDTRFTLEQSKPLMRAALSDLWPPSLRTRGKQGFGAPVHAWMQRRELSGVLDRVFSPKHPIAHLFPRISAARTQCNGQDQWTLLMLGLWLERHSDILV